MHRVALLRAAGHAAFLLIIATGAITFAFFYATIPTRWYNVRATELIAWRNTLILQYKFANATTGKATPLLSGSLSFILIWQWCGTLAVALGSAGLLWLSSTTTSSSAATTEKTPNKTAASKESSERRKSVSCCCARSCWSFSAAAAKKAIMRVRRLLQYQVPPRGLWRGLLGPGGLTLLDLLLVLLWFGLHVMWVREMTMRVLDNRRTAPPPPKAVVRGPPLIKTPSSSAGANLNNRSYNSSMAPPPKFMLPPPAPATSINYGNGTTNGGVRRLLQTTPPPPAAAAGGAGNVTSPGNNSASSPSAKPPSSRPPPPKALAPAKKLKPLPVVVQDSVAKYTGWVGRLDILLLFFPLPRCNFLHWLLGSNFATLIKYHRWLGVGTLLVYSLHGITYMSIWTRDGILSTMLDWGMSAGVNRVAGLVALCGGWLLGLTSIPFIRRRLFNFFYVSHIVGAVVFMLFAFMHRKDVATWVMPGVFLYLLDVVLRTIQQNFNCVKLIGRAAADEDKDHRPCRTPEGVAIARPSSEGVLLSLSIPCHQSLRWVGSDMVFLNVPAISWWQWHPFTITSAPADGPGSENRMEIRIKSYNRWTKALISRVSSNPYSSLTLYVSGPYNSGNRKWITDFDTHVFVAGGIGITPVLGMLAELLAFRRRQIAAGAAATDNGADADKRSARMGRAVLIWVSRTMDELQALPYEILQEASMKDSWLDLRLYLTTPSGASVIKVPYIATSDKGYGGSEVVPVQPSGVTGSNSGSSSPSPKVDPPASPASVVRNPPDGGVCTGSFHAGAAGGGATATATAAAAAVAMATPLGLEALDGVVSRPLSHPYMFSPLIWMVAVLFAFGGGFAGLMCAQAYDAHMSRTVALRQDFSYVGMLQFAALGLGATLPPAVLMLGVHLYWRLARSSSSWPRSGSGCKTAISLVESGSFETCLAVTAKAAVVNGPPTAASGTPMPPPAATLESYITEGRPDLAALLRQVAITGNTCGSCDISALWIRTESSSSSQSEVNACKVAGLDAVRVAVYAAGPGPLVGSVGEICASLNSGICGRRDRAHLYFTTTTHEL